MRFSQRCENLQNALKPRSVIRITPLFLLTQVFLEFGFRTVCYVFHLRNFLVSTIRILCGVNKIHLQHIFFNHEAQRDSGDYQQQQNHSEYHQNRRQKIDEEGEE